ncbi:MAG TPA: response regulator [Syntrophobacteria bacterium]|jgi:CheY-like chemotaxis protein|nr:response regulator [Syntrophobacteria bacterium]
MTCLDREVLVVDDEQGILESFDAMLGDDYRLVTLDNGRDAIDYLEAHEPRLVFLDIKMPGIDGIEVLRQLRERRGDTAVVIVTATTQPQYEIMAEDLGISAYLRKPFDVEEVESITRRVLH